MIFGIFATMVILCTILSKFKFFWLKISFIKVASSFSINRANHYLFSYGEHRLLIADALMLCYLLWLLAAHHYSIIIISGFVGHTNIRNSFIVRVIEESKYFWLRSFMPRDSVFFLFGVIIAYNFFGQTKRPIGVKQYVKFVAENYIRFLPKMLGPLLILNMIMIIGSGPIWEPFEECSTKPFWKNFLLGTNLGTIPTDNV
jgi:hypothetical protein